MASLSLRVPEKFKTDMEALSKATGRSVSSILLDWCTKDLELERWQIERINTGIRAAEDCFFADDTQIQKAFQICKN